MKDKKLQTKRQTKTGLRKLHARVSSSRRKQRVSASASADMLDSEIPNASIGRALIVILLLHVVAIGAIYVGIEWNKGRTESVASAAELPSTSAAEASSQSAQEGSRAFVLAGDTYEAFAARHQVDVQALRELNENKTIHAGMALALPTAKSEQAAVVAAAVEELPLSQRPALETTTHVVKVEQPKAVVVANVQPEVVAPKAMLVKAEIPKAQPVVVAGNQTYLVQPGDSVWRISNKYKVSQEALMQLNGMSEPRELRSGMTLKIPAH